MRRFRLRMTIRTLMITIAATAVLLGIGVAVVRLKTLASHYEARAAAYASREVLFAIEIQRENKMADQLDREDRAEVDEANRQSGLDRLMTLSEAALLRSQVVNLKKRIAQLQDRSDWYAMMKGRYQYAGSHPWFSVAPDPPEPR